MKNNLFHTYLRLFPGMADRILNAITDGEKEADAKSLLGKERQDFIEEKILDRVDP